MSTTFKSVAQHDRRFGGRAHISYDIELTLDGGCLRTLMAGDGLMTGAVDGGSADPATGPTQRLGRPADGNLHFALYDTTGTETDCEVKLDGVALGMADAQRASLTEVLTDTNLQLSRSLGKLTVHCPFTERGLALIAVDAER